MQYKENSLKPGKPHRKPRLTAANCAIDVKRQLDLYFANTRTVGRRRIHVWPAAKQGYARQTMDYLMHQPMLEMVEVNPEDWK